MTAEILAVGTELLMGQIANTNAQYISRRLSEKGISLYRHTVVGDNPGRLMDALKEAFQRADLVITTGGLGPTEDDLTKETVAAYFGFKLKRHEPSYRAMVAWLEKVGRPLTDNNLKQADFPEEAVILPNACGTAPGCVMGRDGKFAAVLPGPPMEMKDMFEKALVPWLQAHSNMVIESKYLHVFGIGESLLETQLIDLFHSDNPTLALYCSLGEVVCRLSARAENREAALARMAPLEKEILRRVGNHFFGEGVDETLASAALRALKARGETVCFAESCTGGLLAAAIVEYAGASDALKESYVTYCDEAKHKILGVRGETLARHTAVSAETAREMAEGARRISGADWGVSVTGIAGPNGGTEKTPVGTVFIGLAGRNDCFAREFHFAGSRSAVRTQAVKNALNLLRLEAGRGSEQISD